MDIPVGAAFVMFDFWWNYYCGFCGYCSCGVCFVRLRVCGDFVVVYVGFTGLFYGC